MSEKEKKSKEDQYKGKAHITVMKPGGLHTIFENTMQQAGIMYEEVFVSEEETPVMSMPGRPPMGPPPMVIYGVNCDMASMEKGGTVTLQRGNSRLHFPAGVSVGLYFEWSD